MKPGEDAGDDAPVPVPDDAFDRSIAGEEDPGASVDAEDEAPRRQRPGDEAAPGTPGTGETLCRRCGGSGRLDAGQACPECGGSGRVTAGIGGG